MLWVERKGKEGEDNFLNRGCVLITAISVSDTLHTSMILFPAPTHQGDHVHPCVCAHLLSHFSHVQLFMSPWSVACQALLSVEFSRQDSGAGCHALFQGIFPTQGLNPHLLHLPCWQAGFFFFFTTSSTWEALWSPLLTDKQIETKGEKLHPWQRCCLGSAAKKLCALLLRAGYLWFTFSFVQELD